MNFPHLFPFPSPDWSNPGVAHAWLQKFLDSFLIGILIIDETGQIRMANTVTHEFFDIPRPLQAHNISDFLQQEYRTRFQRHYEDVIRGAHSSCSCEEAFLLENKARRWANCSFTVLPEQEDGQKLTLVTLVDVSADVSAAKTAQEENELCRVRSRELFDAAADAMMVISPQGILLDLNRVTCEHVHMTREELVGKHMRIIFTSAKQQFVVAAFEEILQQGEQRTFEALLISPDSPIPVEINARPIDFQGRPAVLGIARDITERKILQARLEYQASTDPLTALNNRRHFLLKADQEFLRFKRYDNPFAMLMLDLDFFKNVNDTYGHQTGDALLREFARQMRLTFRHSDILGRIGGEEFSVLLLESGMHRGIEIAERLRQQAASNPLHLNETAVPYTVSIGVTTACASDESLDSIMRRADEALYRAKRNGRNQVEYEKAPEGQT